MNNGISSQFFQRINQAYGNTGFTLKIRGTIVSNNGTNMKIDIGNQRILDMKLKKEIQGKTGDVVTIDKKNILSSKLTQESLPTIQQEEGDKYTKILKSFNFPSKSQYLQVLHSLENHGLDLSKENMLAFMNAKNQLSSIIEGLDYNSAIQLIEKDIDIGNEPLSKVSEAIDETKESEGFTLAKIIKGLTKMTTEEAEKIAEKIYGSKMGKDITDVIKALKQAGLELTKGNIEKVNNVFNKLHSIKEIEDEGLINAVKNKIETTIDNLYKLKKSITKGSISSDDKGSSQAVKVYEGFQSHKTLREKDLRLMEDEIRSILKEAGIEATDKNVSLSKLLLKNDLPINRELIERIVSIKEVIGQLSNDMNKDTIALLMEQGINVDKENINQLLKYINQLNISEINQSQTNINQAQLDKVLSKLTKLANISDEELLLLIKENSEVKLSQINIPRGLHITDLIEKQDVTIKNIFQSATVISSVFSEMKAIDYNTIAFHLNKGIPLTLESLYNKEGIQFKNTLAGNEVNKLDARILNVGLNPSHEKDMQLVKALMNNGLSISKQNVEHLSKGEHQYNQLRNSLTISMVKDSIIDGAKLEKMPLNEVSSYTQGKQLINSYSFLSNISSIKDSIISLLMKNNTPQNLSSVQNISMLLYNRQQLAHNIEDLLMKSKEWELSSLKEANELQQSLKDLTNQIKSGKVDTDKLYDKLLNNAKNLSEKIVEINPELRKDVEKQLEKIISNLQQQGELSKNDTMLQLPVMMNDKLSNLQIYVMNKKKNSKKIDPNNMSILLNIDTSTMDDINVYVGVTGKMVDIKIGVKEVQYKKAIERELKNLEGLMDKAGYQIKDVSFKVDEDQNLMGMVNEIEIQQATKHSIDIVI
ncbi:hypothetical protein F8154_00385 [Alkaliphilus pronyensis]|uniref:Flagellar hook-length control protein-like C-terminal domain-containing protein n=1 Tax=Alkaliphilus pronyensis TaxID=1482732 RepID=A0A6I0FTV4_9FIRM|nr:DUF6240 domain-containing protein [Alkaliphilus pronyensis]KAB3539644.1 hypothetical protein F8154_00385 [Alkaliphilus pronyensis]